MSEAGGRIYSIDFSEAFYVSDTMMLKAFLFNEDAGKAWADNKLDAFCDYIRWLSFDVAREFAPDLHMDPEQMKEEMIAAGKRVLDITDDEIDALAEELSKMYPEGYADYYAGSIMDVSGHVPSIDRKTPSAALLPRLILAHPVFVESLFYPY